MGEFFDGLTTFEIIVGIASFIGGLLLLPAYYGIFIA